MPELPEVETVRAALEPVISGQTIASVRLTRCDLRWPLPEHLDKRLVGRRCSTPNRRSKYILIDLSQQETLLIHLGMSGAIRLYDHKPNFAKHDHFSVEFTSGQWVVFSDPRRFGHLDLFASADAPKHPLLCSLGVEPLSDAFTELLLASLMKGRKTPIKSALLDQRLIAGLGNIYASEALFRAGISPRRRSGTIAGQRALKLTQAIKTVLREAISAGGTSLRDHIQPGGEIGYFVQNLRVYGQAGQPCVDCGQLIKQIIQSGRSSFYCPSCQR